MSNLVDHGGLLPLGGAGLIAAVPVVVFSMMGSEVACIAAAESADPAGNVARASRTVALRILAFYVLSVVVIAAIVPWSDIKTGLSPFKAAADVVGIPGTSTIMLIIIITAVLSCLNSGLYITSRMLYELARGGHAPKSLCEVGGNKVPRLGIAVGCAAGFLAALGQLYMREDVFTILISTSGDIILFVYIIVAFAQIRRRQLFEAAGRPLPMKMWLFPWLSYFVIAGIAAVLVVLAFIPDEQETLIASFVTLGVVLATLALGRRRGWFTEAEEAELAAAES
jgi:L-asparagine transporter-like permease